jgi:glycosyltransferase involved in cell wall biosynthesis
MPMSAPRISAAMIVRDEEAVLEDCLQSMRDEVDEIVVTDTGSRDRSRDIAAGFGARVLERPWDDDFSAARNHSLDAATGDWILYIDADERLDAPRRGTLRRTIERQPGKAAFLMRLQPREGFSTYLEGRLFRRDPRIRFRGRIHEQIWPGVEAVCEAEKLAVGRCAARLVHVGYEGDISHKHLRNLPLLERSVAENSQRVYCWWHLGDTLAALGRRAEAETALRTAIRVAGMSKLARERFDASLAYQTLARIAFDAGEDPLAVIEEGLAALPEDHALRFMRARALINLHRHQSAIEVLASLTAHDALSFADPYLAYDRRIFGEFAHDLTGVALLRLGRFAEASAAFQTAAASAPQQDRIRYRAKAAAAAAKAARRIEAEET